MQTSQRMHKESEVNNKKIANDLMLVEAKLKEKEEEMRSYSQSISLEEKEFGRKLEEVKSEYETRIRELKSDRDTFEMKINELELEREYEAARNREEKNEFEVKLRAGLEEQIQLQRRDEENKRILDTLKSELEDVTALLTLNTRSEEALLIEKESLSKQLEAVTLQLETVTAENQKLQNQLSAQVDIEQTKRESSLWRAQRAAFEQRVEELENELKPLRTNYETATFNLDAAKVVAATLNRDLKSLQKKFEIQQEALHSSEYRVKQLLGHLSTMINYPNNGLYAMPTTNGNGSEPHERSSGGGRVGAGLPRNVVPAPLPAWIAESLGNLGHRTGEGGGRVASARGSAPGHGSSQASSARGPYKQPARVVGPENYDGREGGDVRVGARSGKKSPLQSKRTLKNQKQHQRPMSSHNSHRDVPRGEDEYVDYSGGGRRGDVRYGGGTQDVDGQYDVAVVSARLESWNTVEGEGNEREGRVPGRVPYDSDRDPRGGVGERDDSEGQDWSVEDEDGPERAYRAGGGGNGYGPDSRAMYRSSAEGSDASSSLQLQLPMSHQHLLHRRRRQQPLEEEEEEEREADTQ
eukprot:gene2156-2576_t